MTKKGNNMAIPTELQSIPKWVLWRYGDTPNAKGKYPKTPVNAQNRPINALNPTNWLTYDEATKQLKQTGFDGLGFVLTGDYTVIDIDNAMAETFDNALSSFGQTFIETSVSGNGLHVWLKDISYSGAAIVGPYEIYSDNRYIAVTGETVTGIDAISDAYQDEFDAFLADANVEIKTARKDFIGLLPLSECRYDAKNPIDVMRHNLNIEDILQDNGYTFVRYADRGKTQAYYRRPNKTDGVSLVVHIDSNVCKCFSSNDALWELQQVRPYLTSFDVWRVLECKKMTFKQAIARAYMVIKAHGIKM